MSIVDEPTGAQLELTAVNDCDAHDAEIALLAVT